MSFFRRSTYFLIGASAVGGLGLIYATSSMSKISQDSLNKSEVVQESLQLLRQYKPAHDLLGLPINKGRVPQNMFNILHARYAQLIIPVKGSKESGRLYTWAVLAENSETKQKETLIGRLDLEIPVKKMIFTFYQRDGFNASDYAPKRLAKID